MAVLARTFGRRVCLVATLVTLCCTSAACKSRDDSAGLKTAGPDDSLANIFSGVSGNAPRCFSKTYSAPHLASQPSQTVKTMRVLLSRNDANGFFAAVSYQQKNVDGKRTLLLPCFAENDGVTCSLDGSSGGDCRGWVRLTKPAGIGSGIELVNDQLPAVDSCDATLNSASGADDEFDLPKTDGACSDMPVGGGSSGGGGDSDDNNGGGGNSGSASDALLCLDSGPKQVVLSISDSWTAKKTKVNVFNRTASGQWTAALPQPLPAVLGGSGMGWGIGAAPSLPGGPTKHEGDQRSPAGIFYLTEVFGYDAANATGVNLSMPYHQVTKYSRCVDDSQSQYYNNMVYDYRQVSQDWNSAETLRRTDELYRMAIVVDHNHLDLPGDQREPSDQSGSCIFLHMWSGPDSTTAGCTAFASQNLKAVIGSLKQSKQPVLVQLPRPVYNQVKTSWCLPNMP